MCCRAAALFIRFRTRNSLDALAAKRELTAYIGFDCTAPSLHVGSMVQIMCLYWLQQTGNKPIALMGGGTTRVGDPSGKDETRKILSIEDIERNKDGIKQVFSRFLRFGDGKHDAVMPDNAEWLTKLNWIEMLRDIGRHFSVNRMLAMDSVKLRLERDQEMSFIEFNYMILQAYDFAVLNQRYDCRLQMGGSDQWGNIVNGIDLGRRMGTPQLHALTTPLITTSIGEKMGKTASGAVWLNADMKSPYEYWQFWRNTDDADVARFLKLFTTLPLDEIEKLAALQGAEINEAKKALADSATTLLHGADAARVAAETARQTFEEGAIAENLPTDRNSSRRARSRPRRAGGVRQGRPRRLERRGAAPDQGRRTSRQRRRRYRREDDAEARGSHAGRRDQTVARQEAPRPAQACIGVFALGTCSGGRKRAP